MREGVSRGGPVNEERVAERVVKTGRQKQKRKRRGRKVRSRRRYSSRRKSKEGDLSVSSASIQHKFAADVQIEIVPLQPVRKVDVAMYKPAAGGRIRS